MTTPSRLDLHQTITDRIIAVLEVCSGPWHHSWSGGLGSGRPINRLRSAVRPAPYGSTIPTRPDAHGLRPARPRHDLTRCLEEFVAMNVVIAVAAVQPESLISAE